MLTDSVCTLASSYGQAPFCHCHAVPTAAPTGRFMPGKGRLRKSPMQAVATAFVTFHDVATGSRRHSDTRRCDGGVAARGSRRSKNGLLWLWSALLQVSLGYRACLLANSHACSHAGSHACSHVGSHACSHAISYVGAHMYVYFHAYMQCSSSSSMITYCSIACCMCMH